MVYQEMSKYDMINDLMDDNYAGWTYDQAEVIAEHIEEMSCWLDENDGWSWDRVAIRCEFSGYASKEEAKEAYDIGDDDLEDWTIVLECPNGEVVIQDF